MKNFGTSDPPQLTISRFFGLGVVSLFLIVLSLLFLAGSLRLPPAYSPRDVGPTVFPLIASSATLIFVVASVIEEMCRRRDGSIQIRRHGLVAAVIAAMIGYVALIPVMGTYVSTVALVTGMLICLGIRRPVTLAVVNFITFVMVYVGFEMLLNIRFPRGMLL